MRTSTATPRRKANPEKESQPSISRRKAQTTHQERRPQEHNPLTEKGGTRRKPTPTPEKLKLEWGAGAPLSIVVVSSHGVVLARVCLQSAPCVNYESSVCAFKTFSCPKDTEAFIKFIRRVSSLHTVVLSSLTKRFEDTQKWQQVGSFGNVLPFGST